MWGADGEDDARRRGRRRVVGSRVRGAEGARGGRGRGGEEAGERAGRVSGKAVEGGKAEGGGR